MKIEKKETREKGEGKRPKNAMQRLQKQQQQQQQLHRVTALMECRTEQFRWMCVFFSLLGRRRRHSLQNRMCRDVGYVAPAGTHELIEINAFLFFYLVNNNYVQGTEGKRIGKAFFM